MIKNLRKEVKVLFVTPVLEKGGTEKYIFTLAEYIKNYGFIPMVVSDGGAAENELAEIGTEYIKVHCLDRKSMLNFIKAPFVLADILKTKEINLIHASSVFTTIVSKIACFLCRERKIRLVMTLHGGPTRDIEKKAAKILNIFADKVVALTEKSQKELIKKGLAENKIKVVNNGIKSLKEKESLPRRKIIIGSCGRLTEQKGYEYLIKAAARISMTGIEFRIAGDGPKKEYYQKMIDEMRVFDKVFLIGAVRDVTGILNECDIFILPSLWEPFGIAIIEAMSLGKPVIATNVGGIPEVLGDCGMLINPADPDAIVNAVEMLVNNRELCKELGNKAKERFFACFTEKLMCDKTIMVYEDMLGV